MATSYAMKPSHICIGTTDREDGMPKMDAPASGVTVRMYRQGHGDCFLLAMRKTNGKPFYMLIDCGLWSGSALKNGPSIDAVIKDIAASTGKKLDVVLVTHEHMDHVNGFSAKDPDTSEACFDELGIDQLWLAWTEDGDDEFANELRERFNDTLLALMGADGHLSRAGHGIDSDKRMMLRDLLSFETGDGDTEPKAADELRQRFMEIQRERPNLSLREQGALAIEGITNKKAIKYLRDKIEGPPTFLRPDHGPYELKAVKGTRVYALGPPRNVKQLLSLDPEEGEGFPLAIDGSTRALLAATVASASSGRDRCFDPRFGIPRQDIEDNNEPMLREAIKSAYGQGPDDSQLAEDAQALRDFFSSHYGPKGVKDMPQAWRQIDTDWLGGAEALALRLNDEVNNTSLVIAIELPNSGKVLLFSGDAQRGNWISWAPLQWTVGNKTIKARELLGRTVFYKVGHHGSHNATLSGALEDDHPNLSWLADGEFKDGFVAMIPANSDWAIHKSRPWKHPLSSIDQALKKKARGRVFQTDIDTVEKPSNVSATEWKKFKRKETDLYFEYTVADE
jgi:beta-lactamase superfamily II metal-dependent hydrolase